MALYQRRPERNILEMEFRLTHEIGWSWRHHRKCVLIRYSLWLHSVCRWIEWMNCVYLPLPQEIWNKSFSAQHQKKTFKARTSPENHCFSIAPIRVCFKIRISTVLPPRNKSFFLFFLICRVLFDSESIGKSKSMKSREFFLQIVYFSLFQFHFAVDQFVCT